MTTNFFPNPILEDDNKMVNINFNVMQKFQNKYQTDVLTIGFQIN